jgi:DNA-binding NtrC family response regulator
MANVLVVDDQPSVCTALEILFDLHGLQVLVAASPQQALELVAREDVGVVVQDMNFRRDQTSGAEGVELMRAIRRLDPELPIVLMTAFTSLEMAVQLVKEGANDYVAKPWDDAKLVATVRNLMRLRELQLENRRLLGQTRRARDRLAESCRLCGLVYESARMHEAVSLAVKVAPSDAAVLVTGPNGCGKEKIAEIVQANSRRRDKPFVRVNAGGLPDTLLEAELFGAEAGAYTGASRARIGRFEEANGGTLLLDEVGNLSPGGQAKLLRVLQTGELQRLGSNVTRKTDVRIVSATNVDLARAIRQGTFREDLYFRLNVIEIAVPPLRDRADDILALARFFVAEVGPGARPGPLSLSSEATQALLEHEWPGNVRELRNRVQRAALVCEGDSIRPADLGLAQPAAAAEPAGAEPAAVAEIGEIDGDREEVEQALREAQGVVSRAAAALGISRQALYRRMDRLGIEMERRPKG